VLKRNHPSDHGQVHKTYGSSPKRVGRKTRLTASNPRIFKGFLAFPPSD
jgi:hypothetical protein